MAHRDGRLGLLLRTYVDGIPLDLASELLPRGTRWSPGLAAHVHLHARAQRQHADEGRDAAPKAVTMSATRRLALLDHLRRTIEGLHLPARGTEWADYADQTSYSDAGDRVEGGDRARDARRRLARSGRGTWGRTPVATARSRPRPATRSSRWTATGRRWSVTTSRSARRASSGSCRSSPTWRTHRRRSAGRTASEARCSSARTRTW